MAAHRIFGCVIPAAHLAKKTRMHNLGSNCVSTSRDPALRRSDHEPSAENFRGAFAVQLNRKKKTHLNRGPGIQRSSGPNQQTGNADVLRQTFLPISFSTDTKPDGGPNFIAPGSGDFRVGRINDLVRLHPLSLPFVPLHISTGLPCRLAMFRLGQFPGDSNGPTVLSSYDCIVLPKWNDGVLPRCSKLRLARIPVVRGRGSAFLRAEKQFH